MRDTYTLDQFKKEYPDREIHDFFKHIDRQTSDVDFFSFFDIDKSALKADNNYHYRIPCEVAPLLAGMIRAFSFAYGKNQQGHTRDSNVQVSYEVYHDYVLKMQQEVDLLEPYQQALIKNFHCYDDAKIIDIFLPLLLERISMLIALLFFYNSNQTSDNLIETIELFDKMIDGLARQHVRLDSSANTSSMFTFNDAISNVFKILTDPSESSPPESQVNSVELQNTIKDALKKSITGSTPVDLNDVYKTFTSTHQDIIKLHERKILLQTRIADCRSANSQQFAFSDVTAPLLAQILAVPDEVERAIKMKNHLDEYSWLEGKFNGNELASDAFSSLSKTDQTIYESYKYMLPGFETNASLHSEEYYDFVNEKIADQTELLISSAREQSKLHENRYSAFIYDFFQHEPIKTIFSNILHSLTPLTTTLLTHHLISH